MSPKPAAGAATRVNLARADLPQRCVDCGARIDRGDSYVIEPWVSGGGFDYRHADCKQTAFIGHLERGRV